MRPNRIILLLIFILFTCACGSGDSGSSDGSDGGDDGGTTSNLPECGTEPFFTVSPMSYDDIRGLVPLGNLNPSGHVFPSDHIYFYIKLTESGDATRTAKVYAPGDTTITSLYQSNNLTAGTTDYSIYFSPCKEFQVYFLHVSSISETLESQVGSYDESSCTTSSTGGSTYRNCSKNVEIKITAGDEIGTAGGASTTSLALDMGAYDARINPLDFVDPDRFWTSSNNFDKLHVVCPVDYFADDIRDYLRSLFGNYDGSEKRTVEPLCGTITEDVENTAQGYWYVEGTTGVPSLEDPHLALVHDNVDPTTAAFSVGTSVTDLDSGVYTFEPASSGYTNRDFGEVTSDGNVYCFETAGNGPASTIIIIQLTDSTTLKIEKKDGAACGTVTWEFTSNAVNFVR